MTIMVDSREHDGKNEHILQYFREKGINYINKENFGNIALIVGDYMSDENKCISVDRKNSIQEVYGNLVQQHSRFRDECLRASKNGIKLIILVEEEPYIKCVDDVCLWKNPRRKKWFDLDQQHQLGKKLYLKQPKNPPIGSDQLQSMMRTVAQRYGIEWQFTTKADCGRRIVEILGGEDGRKD